MNLIFTYVWNFGKEKGKINIDTYKKIYEDNGGQVFFIELNAEINTRSERADDPVRAKEKFYAPNKERVLNLEKTHNFESPNPFFYNNYLKIETDNKNPEEIVDEIIKFSSK